MKIKNKYYLYRHIRLDINQPFYIGIGTIQSRALKTYTRAYNKTNRSKFWYNIVNKTEYTIEILLESDDYEFIKQKEIEFIALYGRKDLKSGTLVNLTDGGDGMLNCKFSNEHRCNLSKAKKGTKLSEETKNKMASSKKGIQFSNEHKEKLSKARLGYIPNKKSVEKSAKSHEKKITQYTKNNKFIKEWESILSASKTLQINPSHIGQVCKGRLKSSGGFIWRYKNN